MKKLAQISSYILVVVSMFCPHLFASVPQFGLSASANAIEVNGDMLLDKDYGLVALGGGVTHHDSYYTIASASLSLKTARLLPGFRYGLGFKGVGGKVDEKDGQFDNTLAAIGFWFGIDYELRPVANPINTPIELFLNMTIAPDSMSFENSSQYFETKGGMKLWIVESACVTLSCRYTDIEFETSDHGDWGRNDTVFLGGITLQL